MKKVMMWMYEVPVEKTDERGKPFKTTELVEADKLVSSAGTPTAKKVRVAYYR